MNIHVIFFGSITGTLAGIGLIIAAFIALIFGWIIHPYTVGGFTRWVDSPLQQFMARIGTSVGAAVVTLMFGIHMISDKSSDSNSKQTHQPSASAPSQISDSPTRSSSSVEGPSEEPREQPRTSPSLPEQPVERIEHPTVTQSVNEPEEPKIKPPITTHTQSRPDVVEAPREKTLARSDGNDIKPSKDSMQLKIAELKGQLAVINTKIQTERERWQEGVGVINRLTNFKKTPVREGSPQYHQCMAASQIIKEVEAGAAGLKADKARLEATISSLEGK